MKKTKNIECMEYYSIMDYFPPTFLTVLLGSPCSLLGYIYTPEWRGGDAVQVWQKGLSEGLTQNF